MPMKKTGQGGYSLIEVILSLGLLAGVMLPSAWLLDLAAHQAKSGRTASEALAVARSIQEEMQSWGFHQTHLQYGLDGTATSYAIDTRTNAYASRWQATLEEKLDRPWATILLESTGPGGTAPTMDGTRAIRITVTVYWRERSRHRSISLTATRM
jgi:type II secretory pathway pseudopilin PulG